MKMNGLVFLGLVLLSQVVNTGAIADNFDQMHAEWKSVIQMAVHTEGTVSQVDYAKIKSKSQGIESYLTRVQGLTPADYSKFTPDQRLAFLINAYNALTIKLVLDHYPVTSIKKIGGLFSSAWKIKFFRLLGKERSLDEVEHEMIRKDFNEPRVHLALVCASRGCPGLRAYDPAHLNDELESVTVAFLKDPKRNFYNPETKKLYLGKIFDWYGVDFVKKFGSVKAFVAPRMATDEAEKNAILDPSTQVEFNDYDWSLNGPQEGTK